MASVQLVSENSDIQSNSVCTQSVTKQTVCCPKCGGTSGFRTTFKGFQYYTWTGDTAGYDLDQMSEQKTAFCIDCGYAFPKARILRGKD